MGCETCHPAFTYEEPPLTTKVAGSGCKEFQTWEVVYPTKSEFPSAHLHMSYYVYILSNKRRTVFYTGVTSNLEGRIRQHKSGALPGFTKQYNCNQLIYFEEYSLIHEAIAREKVLKRFRRDWKFQLIMKSNPDFNDLGKDW